MRDRAAELTDASEQEIALLKKMEAWSVRYENSPDAKAKERIACLKAVCLPSGRHWTSERVAVFTEYRDTQIWLKDLLAQEGMAGEQARLLSGGMEIGPWPGPCGYCHLHRDSDGTDADALLAVIPVGGYDPGWERR